MSAMERAGAEDMPEDAERQGLGTPSTRASILEKLVQMGFVERKGKQLLPTKDGHNLVCVLPDVLTSPQLTAEWETKLTAIAKGEADPEGFMVGIEEMTRSLLSRYSQISEDAQKLFQAERVVCVCFVSCKSKGTAPENHHKSKQKRYKFFHDNTSATSTRIIPL